VPVFVFWSGWNDHPALNTPTAKQRPLDRVEELPILTEQNSRSVQRILPKQQPLPFINQFDVDTTSPVPYS
jgi:hypothetical protein